MKGITKVKKEKVLQMLDCPMPGLQSDEVLIQVGVVSICGTDLHLDRWDAWAENRVTHFPRIIGHEFCGKICEVGSDVTRFQVGDFVTSDSHIPCLDCGVCKKGLPHLCNNLQILGIDRDGCFAEYVSIPERSLWKNDPSLSPEIASIQDPLGNAVYATLVTPVAGETVTILGDGPVGLFSVGIARAEGAAKIILTGLNPLTLEIAKTMGADRVFNVNDGNVVQMIQEETEGIGTDILLEMSGNPKAIQEGLKAVRKGGRYSAFGLSTTSIPVDFNNQIIFKGICLFGISGRLMFHTWEKMASLLNSGGLNPSPVITHILDFEDFEKGFRMMEAVPRVAAKVVLVVNPALKHLIRTD